MSIQHKKNYQETIRYLYQLQYSGIKLGLENISRLLAYLGNPQEKWPAIHIAGTNGKGSTAAFIYNILRETGLRVGLFTSPHLIDFSERIRINSRLISWQEIVNYTNQLREAIEEIKPTFFEATSAIAFRYFADREVDVAVVETGLGGRLDATNLVNPVATVITPIDFDHQQFLGTTLRKISREKAGIIKKGIPCFTNNHKPVVLNIIEETCIRRESPLFKLNSHKNITEIDAKFGESRFSLKFPHYAINKLEIRLGGIHQLCNAALATWTTLNLPGIKVGERQLRAGLKKTAWPGRLQIVRKRPLTILDVAHNPQGFNSVFEHLRKHFPGRNIFILIGLLKDKDYKKIADTIRRDVSKVGIIDNFSEKQLPTQKLRSVLEAMDTPNTVFHSIKDGYSHFSKEMGKDDLLVIIGSHYLAGEFFQKILPNPTVDFKNIELST